MTIATVLAPIAGLVGFAFLLRAMGPAPLPRFSGAPNQPPMSRRVSAGCAKIVLGGAGLALILLCAFSVSARLAVLALAAACVAVLVGVLAVAAPGNTERPKRGWVESFFIYGTPRLLISLASGPGRSLDEKEIAAIRGADWRWRDARTLQVLSALALACACVWPPLAVFRVGPQLSAALGPWAQLTGAVRPFGPGDFPTQVALHLVLGWFFSCAFLFVCRAQLGKRLQEIASRAIDKDAGEAAAIANLKALFAALGPGVLRAPMRDSMTPLMLASRLGWAELATWLLTQDPGAAGDENREGWTALMMSAACGWVDCCEALAPFSDPLHECARRCDFLRDEDSALCAAGATALTAAVVCDQVEVVAALCARWGDRFAQHARLVSLEFQAMANPLFAAAARSDRPEMIDTLSPWFDARARDADGNTPLMHAALYSNVKMIRALLPLSDAAAINGAGQQAIDWCRARLLLEREPDEWARRLTQNRLDMRTEGEAPVFACAELLAPYSPRKAVKAMLDAAGPEGMPATRALVERDELAESVQGVSPLASPLSGAETKSDDAQAPNRRARRL